MMLLFARRRALCLRFLHARVARLDRLQRFGRHLLRFTDRLGELREIERLAPVVDQLGAPVEMGVEAGGLRLSQQTGSFGAKSAVRLIERIEQQQIAEMKDG